MKYCLYFYDSGLRVISEADSINGIVSVQFEGILFEIEFGNKRTLFKLVETTGKKTYIHINGRESLITTIPIIHNDFIQVVTEAGNCCFMLIEREEKVMNLLARMPDTGEIQIGRDKNSDIILSHHAVSFHHARIFKTQYGWKVESLSNNYLFVNYKDVRTADLIEGDVVSIMNFNLICGSSFFLLAGEFSTSLCVMELTQSGDAFDRSVNFSRSPRIYRSVDTTPITIDPPPPLNVVKQVPFILSAGPAMTMALAMMVSTGITIGNAVSNGLSPSVFASGAMAVSMLLGALMWPGLLRRYQKKQREKEIQERELSYKEYISDKESEINEKYTRNETLRNNTLSPSVSSFLTAVKKHELPTYFWERNPEDDDFLVVRLGTSNLIASDTPVLYTEEKFTVHRDMLAGIAKDVADRYAYYDKAPVTLSLQHNVITGVFGDLPARERVFFTILENICVLHDKAFVKIVFLFQNEFEAQQYRCLTDISHIWGQDKTIRFIACSENDARRILSDVYTDVYAPEGIERNRGKAHYIIFSFGTDYADKNTLYQMLASGIQGAVSYVFITGEYKSLPRECTAVIQAIENNYRYYIKNENQNKAVPFVPDEFSVPSIWNAFKYLNTIRNREELSAIGIPEKIGFLDMFFVGNVKALHITERWKNSMSYATLATPIGMLANNQILNFDIHEDCHGCHGIVAGTTGSGKSEFLQAYILSLMINYSPEDVCFMLIDFKGGDIAIPFKGLPHVSAEVSNLTASMLYRAIVSLQAESARRQALFGKTAKEIGLDKVDINRYHRLRKEGKVAEPLPHLIIIMDEFAQFKAQHSEYMQALIDIAQIGRSLGIHLILATQKPAGVVDGQIWGNSRFKICLKVLEREDSKAVLQRDEAAFIHNTGRGYLQIGYNEVFSQFQAGYCRAKYIPKDEYWNDEDMTVKEIGWTGVLFSEKQHSKTNAQYDPAKAKTQIQAVTEELQRVSASLGYQNHPLWLEPLAQVLYISACPKIAAASPGVRAVIGMEDIPRQQKQTWWQHDFVSDGSIAVFGVSGTGKTTLVQSVLYQAVVRHTPAQFRLAVIDMNGRSYSLFADLPHTVGIVSAGEEAAMGELFEQLERELSYRRSVMSEARCNTFAEYLRINPDGLPVCLIALENYAKFREAAFQYEDRLINLLNGGQAYGLYFIVTTSSKSGIYYKVREHLAETISFQMPNMDAYKDIFGNGVPIAVEPENIKGRALVVRDGEAVEIQVALPVAGDGEKERFDAMKAELDKHRAPDSAVKTGTKAPEPNRVMKTNAPALGAAVSVPNRMQTYSMSTRDTYCMTAGLDDQKSLPLYIDLSEHTKVFIAGLNIDAVGRTANKLLESCEAIQVWQITGEETRLGGILQAIADFSEPGMKAAVYIADFTALYRAISDDDLKLLVHFVRDYPEIVFVTCGEMKSIAGYRSTDLYLLLCKIPATLFVGDGLNDEWVAYLHASVNDIPKDIREKKRKGSELLLDIDGKYAGAYFREDI